jgi:hypothetical protein
VIKSSLLQNITLTLSLCCFFMFHEGIYGQIFVWVCREVKKSYKAPFAAYP